MALFSLRPHPDYPTDALSTVEVMIERVGCELLLRYEAPDPVGVSWPALGEAVRTDGLWRSTCFELFLLFDDGEHYVEFNFSPSTRWAAYAFDGYRDGMAELAMQRPPIITRLRAGIDVICPLDDLPRGDFRLALSAIIEKTDGNKSYWALAHAPGPPDFHNPACFIATLPAPERA